MNSFFKILECENDPSQVSIDLSDIYYNVKRSHELRRLPLIKHLKSIDLSMNSIDFSFLDGMNVHTLDLSNCNNKTLNNIALPNIKNLNIAYNELEELQCLQQYPTLETLDISVSDKECFDHSPLKALPMLTELTMQNHIIEDFSFLESMPQLTSLDISSCIFEDLTLSSLPKLKSLVLSDNLPKDFSWEKLKGLESLEINVQDIRCLKGLEKLTSLTRLKIDLEDDLEYKASDFNFLSLLPNLSELCCKGIDLSNISMPSLKKLEIDHLTNLATIQHLTSLEYLSSRNGWISDLGPIVSLSSLHTCILIRYQIKDISPLASLPNLETLDLDQNNIKSINKLPPNAFPKLRSLVLSRNKLQEFSLNIPTLENLDLSRNNITSFESLKSLSLPQLTKLRLDGNKIVAEEITFENILPSLVSLFINECGFTKCSIKGFEKLEKLELYYNRVNDLILDDLPHLHSLNLSSNSLVDLSSICVPSLTCLNLYNNAINLSTLPTLQHLGYLNVLDCHLTDDEVGDLNRFESLKILNAGTNQLSKVPQSDSLIEINLFSNNIVSLNDDLNMPALESIIISYNPLKRFVVTQGLPSLCDILSYANKDLEEFSIQNCPLIDMINISECNPSKITLNNLPNLQHLSLPTIDQACLQSFQQLKALKTINFEGGKIEHLQLRDMPSLEELGIREKCPKCSLENLPRLRSLRIDYPHDVDFRFLEKFPNLESLHVKSDHPSLYLPSRLPNLKELDLSHCKLKTQPRLEGFQKLKKLWISNNQLKEVHIQQMPKLSFIDISDNQLTELSISNLPMLHDLDLEKNQLSNIEGLQELPSLYDLNLYHNHISSIANLYTFKYMRELNILKNKITDYCTLLSLHHLETLYMDTTDQDEFVKGLQMHPRKGDIAIDFEDYHDSDFTFTPPLWYLYFEGDFSLFQKMEDFTEYPYARQIYDLIRGEQKELARSMAESQGWPLDVYLRYEYYND